MKTEGWSSDSGISRRILLEPCPGFAPTGPVSKLSRLKEREIRPITAQYGTGSGSDRMLHSIFSNIPRQRFTLVI
jgi:hypothetical protein